MSDNIITINGRSLEFEAGETILEVAKKNGIFIPTLCHLEGAKPTGACRICVVEIKGGRALAPACAMPAARGMVVNTNSPAVLKARRYILSLLLQSGNHNCASRMKDSSEWAGFQQKVEDYDHSDELCDVYGECKLQAYSYRYQVDSSKLAGIEPRYEIEQASSLIIRDFSRCILCGRCIQACNDIQVNNAISHGFRGATAKVVALGNNPLEKSDCVFCGECIQVCPVGALTEKKSRFKIRPWEAKHVRTTCHYCGVGCQLDLHIKDNKIMKINGVENAEPNNGHLCVKGRFGFEHVNSPKRLTTPMIKENGSLRKATWDEALDLVAEKIKETKEEHGAAAIAAVGSARLTNEELFLTQKLFRSVIGTNNICAPFASTGMPATLSSLEKASRILLIGSDITNENPVAASYIKRAVKAGSELIVVDTRKTAISKFAKVFIEIKEGTESVLVNGLIRGIYDRSVRQGHEDLKSHAEQYPLEKVAEVTGASADLIGKAVDLINSKTPTTLVYGTKAANRVSTYMDLQKVLGNLDADHGGISHVGDLCNSQGACDVGFLPDFKPGYEAITERPGTGFTALMKELAGEPGGTKPRVVFCSGEDLAVMMPVVNGNAVALEKIDFLILQDSLENETLPYADVVLPAAAWAEYEGTYTNCESRVSRVRKAVDSPGEAKPGTWIITELAVRLGESWKQQSSREIWENEIMPEVYRYSDIDYDQLEKAGRLASDRNGSGDGKEKANDAYARRFYPEWNSLNYHHRALCAHSEGLLDVLHKDSGMGDYVPPSDPEIVKNEFVRLLKEENHLDKKSIIDGILAEYRKRPGGLIPVLQKVQEMLGYLPVEAQNYIANGLNIPSSNVFGVVSFYSFFTMIPRGKHIIRICLGTACYVKGAGKIADNLAEHFGVKLGETTEDRMFTLEGVRCVGACGLAPVVVIDEHTHGAVLAKEVVSIAESYRSQ